MKFQESAYQFHFTQPWSILKFDDHQFYKVLSGQSLSGVDFSGVYCEELYLMEVKNFRIFHEAHQAITADQLIQDLNEKLKDSIKIIEIINKYFDQKRGYKLFSGIIDKLPFLNRDWYFWRRVKAAIMKNKELHFVLFIDGYALEKDLIKNLLGDYHFYGEAIRVECKMIFLSHFDDSLPGIRWENHEIKKGL